MERWAEAREDTLELRLSGVPWRLNDGVFRVNGEKTGHKSEVYFPVVLLPWLWAMIKMTGSLSRLRTDKNVSFENGNAWFQTSFYQGDRAYVAYHKATQYYLRLSDTMALWKTLVDRHPDLAVAAYKFYKELTNGNA